MFFSQTQYKISFRLQVKAGIPHARHDMTSLLRTTTRVEVPRKSIGGGGVKYLLGSGDCFNTPFSHTSCVLSE